jgi:hypothetical protein
MSFATITLCVASQQMFFVVYFIVTQSGSFWIHPTYLGSPKDRISWDQVVIETRLQRLQDCY